MEYTNAATWLQSQQIPDLPSVHDERPSSTDDWKEQVSGVQGGGIDFGDLQGEHQTPPIEQAPACSDAFMPSPSLFPSSHSFPSPSQVHNGTSPSPAPQNTTFFLPPTYLATALFNGAVPFGSSHWQPPATSQQLPLSSYSSLNGVALAHDERPHRMNKYDHGVGDPASSVVIWIEGWRRLEQIVE